MIHHGDLFDVLPTLPADSIDAGVMDPPYGIGFMGKKWDTFAPTEGESRIVPNKAVDSDNPNLKGRSRGPASSPSAVEYDRSLKGQHEFQAWCESWGREVWRVLKPGAHILACGAPRSYHRMASGLEDAGFEIRDCLAWLFSQGFPKSLNFGCRCGGNSIPYSHAGLSTPERDVRSLPDADVSAAVDAQGEQGQVLLDGVSEHGVTGDESARAVSAREGREQSELARRELHRAGEGVPDDQNAGPSEGAPERLCSGAHRDRGEDPGPAPEAERRSASRRSRSSEQRSNQSASLRLPSRTLDDGASSRRSRCERCGGLTEAAGWGTGLKPSHEPIILCRKPFKGTVEECFARYGTGSLNIGACRIDGPGWSKQDGNSGAGFRTGKFLGHAGDGEPTQANGLRESDLGRWPSNVLLDEAAAALLDAQSGELTSGANPTRRRSDKFRGIYSDFKGQSECEPARGLDVGGASRFFYVAKPSRAERDQGCEHLTPKQRDESRKEGNPGGDNPRNRGLQLRGNHHPTVKPVELMRYLVRLVTPTGGTVLDPFCGSGTTGMACAFEGFHFIGVEREAEYVDIAKRRIASTLPLFSTGQEGER